MDFLYRNATPIYRGTSTQQPVSNGLLSGLFGNLFGGSTPSYRTNDGRRVSARSSPSWWQALSPTPSYKTAVKVGAPATPAQEVMQHCDASFADHGEISAEQTCVCAPADATQIVILDE